LRIGRRQFTGTEDTGGEIEQRWRNRHLNEQVKIPLRCAFPAIKDPLGQHELEEQGDHPERMYLVITLSVLRLNRFA
jgi:hypothetical protein